MYHAAQKSKSTYLPLNEERDIGLPVVSFEIISGAMLPTETAFNLIKSDSNFLK